MEGLETIRKEILSMPPLFRYAFTSVLSVLADHLKDENMAEEIKKMCKEIDRLSEEEIEAEYRYFNSIR